MPPAETDPTPESTGVRQFVTNLAPIEQQVGTHVIAALQQPDTVAVLTTVAQAADGHQRVVSLGLKPEIVAQVQALLNDAEATRTARVPCIGFHCYVQDPGETAAPAAPVAEQEAPRDDA